MEPLSFFGEKRVLVLVWVLDNPHARTQQHKKMKDKILSGNDAVFLSHCIYCTTQQIFLFFIFNLWGGSILKPFRELLADFLIFFSFYFMDKKPNFLI